MAQHSLFGPGLKDRFELYLRRYEAKGCPPYIENQKDRFWSNRWTENFRHTVADLHERGLTSWELGDASRKVSEL